MSPYHIVQSSQPAYEGLWSWRLSRVSIQGSSQAADQDQGDSQAEFFLPPLVSGATRGWSFSNNRHSCGENTHSPGISGTARPSKASSRARQAMTASMAMARASLCAV